MSTERSTVNHVRIPFDDYVDGVWARLAPSPEACRLLAELASESMHVKLAIIRMVKNLSP